MSLRFWERTPGEKVVTGLLECGIETVLNDRVDLFGGVVCPQVQRIVFLVEPVDFRGSGCVTVLVGKPEQFRQTGWELVNTHLSGLERVSEGVQIRFRVRAETYLGREGGSHVLRLPLSLSVHRVRARSRQDGQYSAPAHSAAAASSASKYA